MTQLVYFFGSPKDTNVDDRRKHSSLLTSRSYLLWEELLSHKKISVSNVSGVADLVSFQDPLNSIKPPVSLTHCPVVFFLAYRLSQATLKKRPVLFPCE